MTRVADTLSFATGGALTAVYAFVGSDTSELTGQEFYPHTCTISRNTANGVDDLGQPTFTTAVIATGVTCQFDDAGTPIKYGRIVTILESPRVLMPFNVEIETGDLVSAVVSAATGRTVGRGVYSVVDVRDPGGVGDHLEVELERLS